MTLSKFEDATITHSQPHLKINSNSKLGRKALERMDLLLLTVESLDLNGSQSMLYSTKELGLDDIIPNSVELWKKRSLNPLRKSCRRGSLSCKDLEAMILLICRLAERIYPILRQLLSSKEPKDLNDQRWNIVMERFSDLVEERFNTRRGAVKKMLYQTEAYSFTRQNIITLALCTGIGGVDRLQAYLLDHSI